MRRTLTLGAAAGVALLAAAGLCAASLAEAAGSSPAPSPTPSIPEIPSDRPLTDAEKEALARQDAQEAYDKGLRELEKADKEYGEAVARETQDPAKAEEKARKKLESAKKRYAKAASHFRHTVDLWPENADAWNYLGYTLRRTGKLEDAFDAYWRCLKLKPDHAGAHEYLGEAWLESDRLDQAEGELAWLRQRGAPEAEQLEAAIRRYREANPGAAAAADSARKAQGIDTPASDTASSGK
jgi:tetratricopeptide (TPR) repeat protein